MRVQWVVGLALGAWVGCTSSRTPLDDVDPATPGIGDDGSTPQPSSDSSTPGPSRDGSPQPSDDGSTPEPSEDASSPDASDSDRDGGAADSGSLDVPTCDEVCRLLAVDCGFVTLEDLPMCVADCDAASTPEQRRCIAEVRCDRDAFELCFDPCGSVVCAGEQFCDPTNGMCVDAPDCDTVCEALITGCSFGTLEDLPECVMGCEEESTPRDRTCVLNAACDVDVIRTCFDE